MILIYIPEQRSNKHYKGRKARVTSNWFQYDTWPWPQLTKVQDADRPIASVTSPPALPIFPPQLRGAPIVAKLSSANTGPKPGDSEMTWTITMALSSNGNPDKIYPGLHYEAT